MPKSAGKIKAAEDKEVYDLVDHYLNHLPQKQNEPNQLVQELKEDVDHFRGTRAMPSKLNKNYNLLVKVIEYHSDVQGWEVVPDEYKSYGELSKKLAEDMQSCVRAQLICFSLNEDIPSRHFGKAAVRRETQMLKSVSAMLLCLVGAKWGMSASQVWQLGGFRTWLPRPRSTHIRLPSQLNHPSQALNMESTYTVAVTAAPEPFDSDLTQYINQKHCDAPRRDSFTFYYDGKHELCWRGIVVCSTALSIESIVERFTMKGRTSSDIEEFASDPRFVTRTISTYVMGMAVENLSKISDHFETMRYEACKGPSYGKLNYVLHLQDHLSFLLKLFGPLQDTSEEWPVVVNKPSDQQRLAKSRTDYEYIIGIAEELQVESEKLQAMIKQQIEGKNNSRTTLFAVIAAVYLPLSLATGIFGMNIKQITAPKTSPKWQDVIYIGLPLVAASVAVPLTADRIYRQIQKYAGAKPRLFRWWLYWGPGLLVVCIIVVVVVVVVVVLVETTKH